MKKVYNIKRIQNWVTADRQNLRGFTYLTCPWATAEHKGVKPFLSAASTCASAASSNLTQSINGAKP